MNKNDKMRILKISLAYVGVIVGAGFASGQEILQYYVSFGANGLWGLLISAAFFAFGGVILLQFGSLFMASEHNEVFTRISNPLISKIIDMLINLTLFLIGFVMIAGASTNLYNQFGIPIWAGGLFISIAIILTAFLDVNKVTSLIGVITPLPIIIILATTIYSLMTTDFSFQEAMTLSNQVPTTLPNWLISAINYSSFGLMTSISMSFVIGGDEYSPKIAKKGGILGGSLISLLLLMSFISIAVNIDIAATSSMPLLAILNAIHPIAGIIMSIVILLMIYNTAIGMYYPLVRRMTHKNPKSLPLMMVILVGIGYIISFFGFESLVAYVYPFIGYMGIAVFILLMVQWFRYKNKIRSEESLRENLFELEVKNQDPDLEFTQADQQQYMNLINQSAANKKVMQNVKDSVQKKNESHHEKLSKN